MAIIILGSRIKADQRTYASFFAARITADNSSVKPPQLSVSTEN
jgi:hypothetical protein